MPAYIIDIGKNTTFEHIEGYYDRLYQAQALGTNVEILLPVSFQKSYPGIVPAMLQFIVTWIRIGNAGRLLIDIENTEKATIEYLYKNELIFPAVLLNWNIGGVFTKDGISLKGFLNFKNREFISTMLAGRSITHKLMLINFDHLADEFQLPCFGTRYEFIGNQYSLLKNLQSGMQEVFYHMQLIPEFVNIYPSVIAIIYELMKNTFEWGKEDENNVPLDTNIRGVLFKFLKRPRKSLIRDFANHKGLSRYFADPHHKENPMGELYFVEISIFDGGIGFARKFRSKRKDAEELSEIDILKLCLIKHQTSSRALEKDDKGIGLDRMLRVLDGKGFLRIKTGDLCVYRDLIADGYLDEQDAQKMLLYDWKTKSSETYTTYKRAEGAVLTIIYPLAINLS
ncbi:hypothetical protein J3L18_07860 [Mucilaginibacter gossypii]|uniref:hypothetical protein n=1 Tax=Mucilaginibacter gossypii TaxID=551996 RepID=UPI000DCC0E27|nr:MULTISPECIES: hypothetical protein [Mucilaginibacter]QTE38965.1 hypothetical protein J3L18_07860 [Mucilaginibacter gossypii]RAV53531.1 hypothetical protein DIU36_22870 [Mucilaginibacter rubeus]